MKRKMGIILLGFMLSIGLAVVSHAEPASSETATMQETRQDIDAGNTLCPVSGGPVDKDTDMPHAYKGKVYRFCCPMCIEEFKKDPEKYIKDMEQGTAGEAGKCPCGKKIEDK